MEIAPEVFGEPLGFHNGNWLLSQTLCYLEHLEGAGQARRDPDGDAVRWTAA